MKIEIDFVKHQSLGNVHDSSVENNHKSFEKAALLYKKQKPAIDDFIIEASESQLNNVENSFTISTIHLPERGFINSLEFEVNEVGKERCKLSLKKVSL